MSTPGPAAKRRRLEAATSGIHKPFRSPLKTSNSTTTPATPGPVRDGSYKPATPSTLAHTTPAPAHHPNEFLENRETPSRSTTADSLTTTQRPRPSYKPTANLPSSSPSKLDPDDPSLATLHATIKSLDHRARLLRDQISVLTQASSLPAPAQDSQQPLPKQKQKSRLEILTEKWRSAAQSAAEEVFEDVAARMKEQGGLGAYRKREREQRVQNERWLRGEEEGQLQRRMDEGMGNGGSGEGRQEDGTGWTAEEEGMSEKEITRKVEREGGLKGKYCKGNAEGEDDKEEEEEEGEEENEFTMGSMLDMLHIEYDTIGYDDKEQRWRT